MPADQAAATGRRTRNGKPDNLCGELRFTPCGRVVSDHATGTTAGLLLSARETCGQPSGTGPETVPQRRTFLDDAPGYFGGVGRDARSNSFWWYSVPYVLTFGTAIEWRTAASTRGSIGLGTSSQWSR
jgi:hypothetical protein